MTDSISFGEHGLVAFARESLHALRAALMRDAGDNAATYLQEAGYTGGEVMLASFRRWLAARTETPAEELDSATFQRELATYFQLTGWGSLTVGTLRGAVAVVDSEDWSEADPSGTLDQPACHFTTGMFADFFGRLADAPLAVLEVECRSTGSPRCRFLIGSAELMEHVYEELGRGVGYEEAVESGAPGEGGALSAER